MTKVKVFLPKLANVRPLPTPKVSSKPFVHLRRRALGLQCSLAGQGLLSSAPWSTYLCITEGGSPRCGSGMRCVAASLLSGCPAFLYPGRSEQRGKHAPSLGGARFVWLPESSNLRLRVVVVAFFFKGNIKPVV